MNSQDKHFTSRSARSRQKREVLLARPDFIRDTKDLHERKLSKEQLEKEVIVLIEKYKLGPSWIFGLVEYIDRLDPTYLIRLPRPAVEIRTNKETGINELWIRINEDTTLEDIKQRWSFIKWYQEKLDYTKQKKFQPNDKAVLERNKFVYELRENGLSHQQIADKLNDKYPDEVFVYSDIATMLRNYKRQTGIN
ncbi:hypothetical protein DYH10_00685 [Candidatus Saccharibacteria bacterium CPR2]|nr:hypothetical protein [Candidatus Saccharibacteria bacterium CPR2]